MNYTDFISSIKFTLQGVSAVFIVMGIIALIVYLFAKMNKGNAE